LTAAAGRWKLSGNGATWAPDTRGVVLSGGVW